jgi:hypothetical protein
LRFADLAARSEAGHPGFEVVDGRAVDGVEAFEVEGCAFDPQHFADGEADAVGSFLAARGEDAGERPLFVAARMTGAELGRSGFFVMEPVEDFDVGE